MTTLDVLLAAILASPDDDLARLAYADALEERGEPGDDARAEFIRVQMAGVPPCLSQGKMMCDELKAKYKEQLTPCKNCAARWEMLTRERQLMGENVSDEPGTVEPRYFRWLGSCAPVFDHSWIDVPGFSIGADEPGNSFVRGFVERVKMPTADWHEHGPRLVREHPIRTVNLTGKFPVCWGHDLYVWWEGDESGQPFRIPAWLDITPRPHPIATTGRTSEVYPTSEAAHAALSGACLAWARAAPTGKAKKAKRPWIETGGPSLRNKPVRNRLA